jgi:hypothetical protein
VIGVEIIDVSLEAAHAGACNALRVGNKLFSYSVPSSKNAGDRPYGSGLVQPHGARQRRRRRPSVGCIIPAREPPPHSVHVSARFIGYFLDPLLNKVRSFEIAIQLLVF